MRELWIGIAEVLTDAETGDGHTRAFTNVVAWASCAGGYTDTVRSAFSGYGWDLLGIEALRPVSAQSDYEDEIAEVIERAQANPSACIYSTLHYYPSLRA